jgi:hypothetical protein
VQKRSRPSRSLRRLPAGPAHRPSPALPALVCTALAVLSLARPLSAAEFIRGDVNGDGSLDITDPVAALAFLFAGGPPLPCADAADFNDSGNLDISDPVSTLAYLFQGGAAPGEPFPLPGFDPSPDGLGCLGEDDPGLEEAMAPLPTDGEDRLLASEGRRDTLLRSAGGSPLRVGAAAFDQLLTLKDGERLQGGPGLEREPFLDAFFAGRPPAAGSPTAYAVDALAPAGADGCFRVPPSLIDGGSHAAGRLGTFIRGDLDRSGAVDYGDAEALDECLRGLGPCPEDCWDVADADDDGRVGPSDVQAIYAFIRGEWLLPPPGAFECGPDPTPDSIPPCLTRRCAPRNNLSALWVEPEEVCGPGPHTVTLVAVDEAGNQSRATAVVTLCAREDEDCPPAARPAGDPHPAAPADRTGDLEAPFECRWVVTTDDDPEELESDFKETVYDSNGALLATVHEPPVIVEGAMEIYRTDRGPGPDHAIYAGRQGADCSTPPSELSLLAAGGFQLRVNLVCLDAAGTSVSCDSDVEIEGVYRSRVELTTASGGGCGGGGNRLQAISQDEAALVANQTSLFAKAAAVESGNQVTGTPSFSTDFGVGIGAQGVSADSRVRFGYSSTVLDHTGVSRDILDGFGNAHAVLPLTLNLAARGRVEVAAHQRTAVRAKCSMLVAGTWLLAKSGCPGAAPLSLSEITGEDPDLGRADALAEHFRETRLGR